MRGKYIYIYRERERENLPPLGRDSRFFPDLSESDDLSLGLLCDLEPIPGLELASSTKSSRNGLDFGLVNCVTDVSCMLADLLGEEIQPSELDGPVFSLERLE